MKLVNIAMPKELGNKVELIAKKSYTSAGEFVRTSIVRLLARYEVLPQAAKIDLLRKLVQERMRRRKEPFEPELELKELKRIRERIYNARSS